MIPLRDDVVSRTTPFVTWAIVLLNVVALGYELHLGRRSDRFLETFGLVPVRFHVTHDPVRRFVPVVTSLFLHGGLMHLVGNMLFLHIFGDGVEDRLGHGRFLFFYLACGAVASLVQVEMLPRSALPMIGASGAIAGVAGAYFVLYPRARVLLLIPIFVFYRIVEVPAVVFLLLWFAMQLAFAMTTLGAPAGGGVAWWAHVGGFGGGVAGAVLLRRRR